MSISEYLKTQCGEDNFHEYEVKYIEVPDTYKVSELTIIDDRDHVLSFKCNPNCKNNTSVYIKSDVIMENIDDDGLVTKTVLKDNSIRCLSYTIQKVINSYV